MRKTTLFKALFITITLITANIKANATYSGTGTFTKISALTDLTDGYYVIGYGTTFAMSNTNAGTYFGNTAITPSNNSLTDPATAIVWEIKNHTDGGRTIYNEASAKYASYTGTANAAQAVTSITGGSERWTFAYTSTLFTITNITSTTRLLQYNTSSPRFACYTGSQQNITLYKLQIAATAPIITPASPAGTVGTVFTFNISATNSPTSYTLTNGTLPEGLSMNTTTGAITGTPTAAGTANVTVTATNAIGTSSPATISFNIAKASQTITFGSLDTKTSSDSAFNLIATSSSGLTVSYVSSNTSVATISGSTVSIVGVGTTTITASQVGNDNYNAASSVNQDLTVVQYVTPTITITEISVPAFSTGAGTSCTQTVNVSGVNLTGDITMALSGANANQFSISQPSIVQSGGSATNTIVTITYSPTVEGTHTATLTFSSAGAIDVMRTLNGISGLETPIATDATAVSSTGFTANWNTVSGATEYQLTVYSKSSSGTSKLSENFDGFTAGTATVPDGTDISASLDTYAQTAGWTGVKVYQAAGTIKLGSSSALGSLTTPSIDLSANAGAFTVSFKAMAWSGDATSLKIYLNDVLVNTITGLNATSYTMSPFSVNLTGGTATSKIRFEGNAAAKGRFFLEDIIISQVGGSTSSSTPLAGSPFTITGTTSKTFTGLQNTTDYYYSVVAKNATSTTITSNEIHVSTLTALATTYSPLNVSANNGVIKLVAEAGETIEVYNALGQKILHKTTTEGVNIISLSQHGVLVVKLGNKVAKIIL